MKAGENDCGRVITITKTKNLVLCFGSFFAAYKYGHADHLFRYTQFDAPDGGFLVPLSASLVEEDSNVGLAKLITLCRSDFVISLLAFRRRFEVDWSHFIKDASPFFGYDF